MLPGKTQPMAPTACLLFCVEKIIHDVSHQGRHLGEGDICSLNLWKLLLCISI